MVFGGPNCTEVWAPTHLSYLSGTVSVVLTLITFPANLLVCLAIVLDPNRELRTPFNYLLLSLATTDLVVGGVMDPVSAVFHYSEALKVDTISIKILHILFFILSTASLLTLAALTIDRYIAVTFPHAYKTTFTPKRALFATVFIWVISLGLSFIYFPLGYIYYAFIFANVAVVSTFLVLVFVYWSIYKKLNVQMKLLDNTELQKGQTKRREKRKKQKMMKKDNKATQALVIVLLVFIICYSPACVMIYVLNLCSSCDCVLVHWFRDMQFLIVLLNSGVNPYLYAFRLQQFRKAFHKLVRLPLSNQINSSTFDSKSDHAALQNMSVAVVELQRTNWLENTRESGDELENEQLVIEKGSNFPVGMTSRGKGNKLEKLQTESQI